MENLFPLKSVQIINKKFSFILFYKGKQFPKENSFDPQKGYEKYKFTRNHPLSLSSHWIRTFGSQRHPRRIFGSPLTFHFSFFFSTPRPLFTTSFPTCIFPYFRTINVVAPTWMYSNVTLYGPGLSVIVYKSVHTRLFELEHLCLISY